VWVVRIGCRLLSLLVFSIKKLIIGPLRPLTAVRCYNGTPPAERDFAFEISTASKNACVGA